MFPDLRLRDFVFNLQEAGDKDQIIPWKKWAKKLEEKLLLGVIAASSICLNPREEGSLFALRSELSLSSSQRDAAA